METRSSFAPPPKGTCCTMCSIESTFVEKGMLRCPDCDDAVYCSPECREWHWENQHQHECRGRHDEVVDFEFKDEETQSVSSDSYDHAQNTTITMLNVHNPNPLAEDPCSRLHRIYTQDDGFIDKEFENYAQAYYDKRQQEREEERQSKWYNCKGRLSPLVFWGLVIQVVVVFVLSIVYATMEKGQSESPNNRPSSTNTTLLDPPPSDLLEICNADAVATLEGNQACQDICDPVQCCYMSETNPAHCWRDNLKTCHEYRKACAVLGPLKDKYHNRTQAPPAPTTTVYPNALVLWDKPELLPPAPSTLMETCQAGFLLDDPWSQSETTGATLTCHEFCYRASCCWDSRLTHPADRCWTHQNCAGYAAACSHLLRDSHDSGAKSVLALETQAQQHVAVVANSCAHARGNLNDLLHCQQACLPSECCWNSAFVDNCKDESQCNAQTTEVCSTLSVPLPVVIGGTPHDQTALPSPGGANTNAGDFTFGNDITTTPTNNATDAEMVYSKETIRDACWNHDNSIRTPGHKSLCEQVCQPGSCCYDEDQTCPGYLSDDFCTKYEPCTIIAIQEQNSLKTKIETACANRNDLSECVQLCGTGTCCYTNDPWKTCITTQPDTICSDYAGCEVLYGAMQDNSQQQQMQPRVNGDNRQRQLRQTATD